MNNDQQRQREFIEKLLAVQQKRQDKPLSKNEQQEIAAQIGLSDADWQAVQETYKAHLLRGRGFLSHQNYDDAIAELEQANVLDYNSIDTTATLAQAHFERFREYADKKDKEAAISYSKICLNQNPSHNQSLKIISDLKRKPRKINTQIVTKRKSYIERNLFIILPLIIVFGILAFFFLNSPNRVKQEEFPVAESTEEININIDEEIKKVASDYPPNKNIDFNANEYEIPIEITDPKLKNLEWQTESALVTKYNESYKVELIGDFLVKNAEINQLKIKLELFDDKGEIIRTTYEEVVKESDLTLRKDDLIPFQVMKYEKTIAPNIAKVVISSSVIEQEELNEALTYEPSPKIPVTWAQKRPQNTDIQLRERQSNFSEGILGNGFHRITLEIENTGNASISLLKFQFSWFNSAKKLLGTEVRYGVSGSTSKLKRNQIRVLSTTMAVPKVKEEELSKLTYQVEVIEVK
ncbi:hypothetical protein V9L05_23655 (plasmid) [Bernardetia sp. Wsw4-3y2]|uniref:tetratricopeptide repeat protein n=1 Tax=Bernardetia sp. Wsw4-3y2 TaxID=3127471 RepID=UPI0030CB1300